VKISEYTLLEDAFHNSFGFMLNRISESEINMKDPHASTEAEKEYVEERCFNEFVIAIEEMGVELEDARVTKDV